MSLDAFISKSGFPSAPHANTVSDRFSTITDMLGGFTDGTYSNGTVAFRASGAPAVSLGSTLNASASSVTVAFNSSTTDYSDTQVTVGGVSADLKVPAASTANAPYVELNVTGVAEMPIVGVSLQFDGSISAVLTYMTGGVGILEASLPAGLQAIDDQTIFNFELQLPDSVSVLVNNASTSGSDMAQYLLDAINPLKGWEGSLRRGLAEWLRWALG